MWRVCGDGNCGYYSVAAGTDSDALRARGLWELQHAGSTSPTPSDLRLQNRMRGLCVDWLQRPENATHRVVGTSGAPLQVDETDPTRYKTPPPPSASAMEPHRQNGTYANMAILKAMAEILDVTIISIDGRALYDRVPVFQPAQPTKSCRVCSWRAQLAPLLLARASASRAGAGAQPPQQATSSGRQLLSERTIVIVNNGLQGAGGHFDATRRR